MSPRIAVIGGGVAGLSCACELAERGIPVTLFEAARDLGGRVSSFRDPRTGMPIDNCQHVLLGCCSEAIAFLRRIGSVDKVEFHNRLNVIDGETRLTIESSFLPAPLHLLPSIARTDYLNGSDKLALGKALGRMLTRHAGADQSAQAYVKALGCGENLMWRLIDPIVISALNEPASEASAKYARMVMVRSLLKGRGSYRLGVPTAPQSELIAGPARRWLESRGCRIMTGSRVAKINIENAAVSSLSLASGESLTFDACVAAVPPAALSKIGVDPGSAANLRWKPIISAHLFLEEPAPPFAPACVVGEPFGWVFSKRPAIGYVEAVASAAEGFVELPNNELLALAKRAASAVEPVLGATPLKRGIVFRTRRATFATLGCDHCRPKASGSAANLYLAGDWTDTGWPATIESAVRSGCNAAREILLAV